MVVFVKLIGIVMVAVGAIYLVKPDTIKQYMDFWLQGNRVYGGAVTAFIVGVIFLMAASQCTLPTVVVIIGILSLAKGIMLFIRGPKRLQEIKKWLDNKSGSALRQLAILTLAIGILVIYAA